MADNEEGSLKNVYEDLRFQAGGHGSGAWGWGSEILSIFLFLFRSQF